MSRRGENIHKRKDGRWEARYVADRYEDGRPRYKSLYARTYSEVKLKLRQALTIEKDRELNVIQSVDFDSILNSWMNMNKARFKKSTLAKYRYMIDTHISPSLGKLNVASIDMTIINNFVQKKLESGRLNNGKQLQPSYVRSMLLIITSALGYAAQEQLCSPLNKKITLPKTERNELKVLTNEQQKRIENYFEKTRDLTSFGTVISLSTGLRIGEVCSLKWEDIDIEQGILHVRTTLAKIKDEKNGKMKWVIDKPKTRSSFRDIPIASSLLEYFKVYKNSSSSQYVISDTESFVNPRTYEYRFHKLLEKCGVPKINYHALRHTFATRSIEAGIDAKTLSEILGHANVGVTLNTYVHSSMELKRREMEKLTSVFSLNGKNSGQQFSK